MYIVVYTLEYGISIVYDCFSNFRCGIFFSYSFDLCIYFGNYVTLLLELIFFIPWQNAK